MEREASARKEKKTLTLKGTENEAQPLENSMVAKGKCAGRTTSGFAVNASSVNNFTVIEEEKNILMDVANRSFDDKVEKWPESSDSESKKSEESVDNNLKNELRTLKIKLAKKELIIEQLQVEHQKAIAAAKRKQWCLICGTEAIMYCCWNTSYCSVRCQTTHWDRDRNNRCRRKRIALGNPISEP